MTKQQPQGPAHQLKPVQDLLLTTRQDLMDQTLGVQEKEEEVETQLGHLPRELLQRILHGCSMDRATVNQSYLALRLCSRSLLLTSDSARPFITLHPDHLHPAASFLTKLTGLSAAILRSTPTLPAPITVDNLAPLTSTAPSLDSITLDNCSGVRMSVCDLTALLLPWENSLRHLELHRCNLTASQLARLGPDMPLIKLFELSLDGWSPQLPSLTSLVVTHDASMQYLDLTGCPKLADLQLSNNYPLLSLKVAGMGSLQKVSCISNTLLEHLDLSECSRLDTLHCNQNKQMETVALNRCSALRLLKIMRNHSLRNVSLSGCTALEDCSVVSNRYLTHLDTSSCSLLHTLSVRENESMKGLLLGDQPHMTSLNCSGSGFTSLDVSMCVALQELHVTHIHSLVCINVSGLKALREIECQHNWNLASLIAAKCTALQTVTCTNQWWFKSLDLAGCSALRSLVCRENKEMVHLHLEGCTSLEVLDTRGCVELKDVDISFCPVLKNPTWSWEQGGVSGTPAQGWVPPADSRTCCIS